MKKVLISAALMICAMAYSAKAQTTTPTGDSTQTQPAVTDSSATGSAPVDTTAAGSAPSTSTPSSGSSNDSGTRLRIYSGKHDGNNYVNKPK